MDFAATKHLSINKNSGFQGSLATKKEDIVAMLSKIKNRTTPYSAAAKKNKKLSDGTLNYVLLPFAKETVNGTIAYKVGNTKTWKETVCQYCDFPNHCDGMHWHKHKATNCKSRLRNFQSNQPLTAANLATDESPYEEPADNQPDRPDDSNGITSLLASALKMCGDNPEIQGRTAMALLAANLVCVLRHGLTKIAPIISVYLLFTSPWPVLYLSLHIFFLISSIALI